MPPLAPAEPCEPELPPALPPPEAPWLPPELPAVVPALPPEDPELLLEGGELERLPPLEPEEPPEEPDEEEEEELGELGMLEEDCWPPAQPPIRNAETEPTIVTCAAMTSSRCVGWHLCIARSPIRSFPG